MDNRRYYVIGTPAAPGEDYAAASGERGPFSLAELHEAVALGHISENDLVRTGLGTMIGPVGPLLAAPNQESTESRDSRFDRRSVQSWIIPGLVIVMMTVGIVLIESRGPILIPEHSSAPSPAGTAPTHGDHPPGVKPAPPVITPPPSPTKPESQKTSTSLPNTPTPVTSNASVTLLAGDATIKGSVRLERPSDSPPHLSSWTSQQDEVQWTARFTKAGSHIVVLNYACPASAAGSQYRIFVGSRSLTTRSEATKDGNTYQSFQAGFIHVDAPGDYLVRIEKLDQRKQTMINLRHITVTPR